RSFATASPERSIAAPEAMFTGPPGNAPSDALLVTTSVPASTLVGPEYVFAPEIVSVPEPIFRTSPDPPIALARVRPSDRLKISAPLVVIEPAPIAPDVVPAPNCRAAPGATVVAPL